MSRRRAEPELSGLTSVPGIQVGHATDVEARTGCTVVLGPFRAACDVRGLATGTRELETLSPVHLLGRADAVLLTGGSAFGLAAAAGVMQWLEQRGRGFDAGVARVPIVPAAVVFDLGVGSGRRPDPAMGSAACDAANAGPVAEGAVGAGAGSTVGKVRGVAHAMPGGVGSWAVEGAEWTLGALVVVNAFGDVLGRDGRILAGARADDGEFVDAARVLREDALAGRVPEVVRTAAPGANTTLAVVATDAPVDRAALQSIARAAATGVARRIAPVHTPFDGDVTFALSTAPEPRELSPAAVLALGAVATEALERSIERAVRPTANSVA